MDLNETSTKVILIIVVLFTGFLITVAIVLGNAPPAPAPSVDIKNVKTDGNPFIGQANAPMTIVEWADYQCPACKSFEFNALPQIIKDYVDTGKVKMVFLDFAFLGNDSITGALYGHSIWKLYPDKYLAWRTAMYTAQDEEKDIGFGDAESIDKLDATIAGIDATAVAADVKANTPAYQVLVDADRAEGQKVNVNSTPSIGIGTQLIAGAQPYTTYKSALDAVLK